MAREGESWRKLRHTLGVNKPGRFALRRAAACLPTSGVLLKERGNILNDVESGGGGLSPQAAWSRVEGSSSLSPWVVLPALEQTAEISVSHTGKPTLPHSNQKTQ